MIYRIVQALDLTAQATAWALGKAFPTVRGAGVFHYPKGSNFIDAWKEAAGCTVRLGRVELQVDLEPGDRRRPVSS
jgi:hypothetical protein